MFCEESIAQQDCGPTGSVRYGPGRCHWLATFFVGCHNDVLTFCFQRRLLLLDVCVKRFVYMNSVWSVGAELFVGRNVCMIW